MIIASQKRKENIAEYLLYMWQIEDLIRANGLNLEKIKANIIDRYDLTEEQRRLMTGWYESLIEMMWSEGIADKGHLQINKNVILQLAQIHDLLLKNPKYAAYSAEYYKTLPFIVELRAKAGKDPQGEIETCFTALYGTMVLRLQGKTVSAGTQKAVSQITRFIAMLSRYFKLYEEDALEEL